MTLEDREQLIKEARAFVASWDLRGSWTADSPVGMVARLVDALEGTGVDLMRDSLQPWERPHGTASSEAPPGGSHRNDLQWEYVRGHRWVDRNGSEQWFAQSGILRPGYVPEYLKEGGEVIRRQVTPWETVSPEDVEDLGAQE